MMETFEIADALEGLGLAHEKAHYIAETIKDKSVSTRDIIDIKDHVTNVEISNIEIKDRLSKVETSVGKVETSVGKVETDITQLKANNIEIKSSIKWLTILLISFNLPILIILITKALN